MAQANSPMEGVVFTAGETCVVSPDETVVAVDGVGVFDVLTGEKRYDIAHEDVIFSPDSRYFSDANGAVYDAQTGAQVLSAGMYEIAFVPLRAFSPDSRWFINSDGVYHLETGELQLPLRTAQTSPRSSMTPQFVTDALLSVHYTNYNETGDLSEAWYILYDTQTFEPVLDTRDMMGVARQLIVSPDTNRYVIQGLGIYDLAAQTQLTDFNTAPYALNNELSVTFSPNHQQVVRVGFNDENEFVAQIFELATGELVNQFRAPYDDGSYPFTFSDDFATIAIRQTRNTRENFTLWFITDVGSGDLIQRLTGSDNSALTLAGFNTRPDWTYAPPFQVNGRYISATSGDVLDVATDTLIFDVPAGQNPTLTSGGSYVVSQAPCTVWRLPESQP